MAFVFVSAPNRVREGQSPANISLIFQNVSIVSATVTVQILTSTAQNGLDFNFPVGTTSFSLIQSPPGNYVLDLGTLSIVDDLMAEGVETITLRISAPGHTFANGQSFTDVEIALFDNEPIIGGAAADTLVGTDFGDDIRGLDGADTLSGGAGDDTLTGGAGDDVLSGGAGTDTVVFSAPRAFYSFAFQPDGSLEVAGPDGRDRFTGVELLRFLDGAIGTPAPGLTLTGTAGADAIGGGSGDDLISGLGGDDRLFGLAGQDTLQGGDGADLLNGADGGDNLSGGTGADLLTGEGGADLLNGGDGNDTVYGGADGDTLSGEGGNDLLNGNDGADFLSGGAGNDLLSGEGGADVLIGGDGDDVIVGGAFGDALTGGAGRDTFVFVPLGDSVPATPDTILDFTRGEDTIDLTQVDANSTLAGDQAFTLVGGFTGVAGQGTLIYEAALNRTVFRGDVTGDGVADVLIIIIGQVGAGDGILL